MRSTFVFIVVVCSLFFSHRSIADDGRSWSADKIRLDMIANNHSCEEFWGVLWPRAKSGNIEARKYLLTLLMPPPHMDRIYFPGSSGDTASTLYDALIMAVHADISQHDGYSEVADSLYKAFGFDQTTKGKKFLACKQEEKVDCSSIAIAENLVPSFDEYALKIDALLMKGIKGGCFRD